MVHHRLISPTVAALCAALFFGGSTPFAKQLLNQVSPILLVGLLYVGSGLGLFIIRLVKDKGWRSSGLKKNEWPWLLGAISFGGIIGPILFMLGLQQTNAATASLLLNLEAVLTSVLAWVVFKENTDLRMVFGIFVIIAGGILLSWPEGESAGYQVLGPLLIAGACLCWGIDNNFTRMVSIGDPFFIVCIKGIFSGLVSTIIALLLGSHMPTMRTLVYAMFVGLFGYGASLVLFVLALRGLGTARTGAYFSTAPFIGAAIAILLFHEPTSSFFCFMSLRLHCFELQQRSWLGVFGYISRKIIYISIRMNHLYIPTTIFMMTITNMHMIFLGMVKNRTIILISTNP